VFVDGSPEVLIADGSACADFGADHTMDHQGMTRTPGGQQFVHIDQDGQQSEGQMQNRLIPV
jgi:hypothetical protein